MSRKVPLILVAAVLCGLVVFAALKSLKTEDSATEVSKAPAKPDAGEGPEDPVIEFVEDSDTPPRELKGNIAGKVVDPDGEPVEGAAVILASVTRGIPEDLLERFEAGRYDIEEISEGFSELKVGLQASRKTKTDARGWFAIDTDAKGPFTVTATVTGYPPVTAKGVKPGMKSLLLRLVEGGAVSGSVVDDAGAPVVGAAVKAGDSTTTTDGAGAFKLEQLPSGSEVTVTARSEGFKPASATVSVVAEEVSLLDGPLVLVPFPGIVGRVLDPQGKPLAEVSVRSDTSVLSGINATTTDQGGRFFMKNEEGGELDLYFRHAEYLPKTVKGIRCGKGERTKIEDVKLEPGGEIVGTVLSPEGKPVPKASIVALPKDFGQDMNDLMTLSMGASSGPATDKEGRYRVAGLESGVYSVIIQVKGFVPFERKDVVVRVPEKTTVDATLSLGASISGRVLDSTGKPVAGASVSSNHEGQPMNMRDVMLRSNSGTDAKSAEDGAFVLTGFDDRSVALRVSAEGYVDRSLGGVEPGTSGLEVRLTRCGTISGRVVDADTGEPIPGVSVSVIVAGGRPSAECNDQGEFTIPEVTPGTCKVRAEAPTHAPTTVEDVELAEGGTVEGLEIRLGAGVVLTGVVVAAADGTPVEGARVRVNGEVSRSGRTDEAGRFQVKGLTPGHYDLTVRHKEFAKLEKLAVPAPSPEELRIALKRGGSVRGIVRDADGKPLSGRMVMLGAGSEFGSNMATTKSDGTFEFENLAPGKYTAIVMNWGGGGSFEMQTQSRSVTVREGEETFIEIGGRSKGSTARLTGRLMNRGAPLGSRMIFLIKADMGGGMSELMSSFKMVTTDEEGRFDIAEIEPGKYRAFAGMMGGQEQGVGVDLEITEGGEVKQDIILPEGRLSGRVTRAESGKPVAGAKVMVVDPVLASRPAVSLADILSSMLAQAVSDSEGRFEIPNVPPGTHLVQVLTSDLAPVSMDGVRVTKEGGSPLRIPVPKGYKVTVAVASVGGGPVSGASALLFDAKGRRYMVPDNLNDNTGPDGKLVLRLSAGAHVIHVQKEGLAPESRRVTVSRDDEVRFDLTPGGAAHLTVTGAGPVAGANVRIYGDDGSEIAFHITQETMMSGMADRTTDEAGRVVIPNLPPGTHRFVATSPDGRRGEANVRITEGGQEAAVIRVK